MMWLKENKKKKEKNKSKISNKPFQKGQTVKWIYLSEEKTRKIFALENTRAAYERKIKQQQNKIRHNEAVCQSSSKIYIHTPIIVKKEDYYWINEVQRSFQHENHFKEALKLTLRKKPIERGKKRHFCES